jgi:DNA-binding response OmpR family regulator
MKPACFTLSSTVEVGCMDDVRLLLVDHDSTLRSYIKEFIITKGYFIDEAADGIAAIKLFRRNEYNLIILDAAVPELDGHLVCSQIRKVSDVPILITSVLCKEEDRLSYYDVGIDDFIIKPYSSMELLARIKVFLRRTAGLKNIPSHTIFCSGIHIDTLSRAVSVNDRTVPLTPKEYELLLFLIQNPNKAFSRETILNKIWGPDFFGSDRTVDTHIKTLRESIKPCQNCITTVWGFGYKFAG